MKEKWHEKYMWAILLGIVIVFWLNAGYNCCIGYDPEESIPEMARSSLTQCGVFLLPLAIGLIIFSTPLMMYR